MISSLAWIPRAMARDKPVVYELSAAERAELEAARRGEAGEDAAEDDDQDANAGGEEDPTVGEDGEDGEDGEVMDVEDAELAAHGLSLDEFAALSLNAEALERDHEEDDSDVGSDAEDNNLKPNDRLFVTCSVDEDGDATSLEVYVYDQTTGSVFVHHDIALPAYPLCVEWLGGPSLSHLSSLGCQSFAAVGTLEPDVEIWSLDVMDALEPNAVLRGHTDAVMSLSWNALHASTLASGSADASVKVWDLATQTCARTFKQHADKVQVVAWNPAEATALLTAGFDAKCRVFDARSPEKAAAYDIDGSAESACWNPHNPVEFGVTVEDGPVCFFDVRRGPRAGPLFFWQAHRKTVSCLTANPWVRGMFATASVDKTVRLWDVEGATTDAPPRLVGKKKADAGKLFACGFARDDPFLVAFGGSEGAVALWHADNDEDEEGKVTDVSQAFEGRVLSAPVFWGAPSSAAGSATPAEPPAESAAASVAAALAAPASASASGGAGSAKSKASGATKKKKKA